MKREEAIEVVRKNLPHLGIGATEMTDALGTLIPEFGKAGSDKVIDHEDKYKEALLEARAVLEPCLKYSKGKVREALDSIDNELKRFESEDERIRMALIKLMTVAGENYVMSATGFKKERLLAYLEKQKEPENTSASTMAPSCWAEEPSLQKEQKPDWSEEDEENLNSIISCLNRSLDGVIDTVEITNVVGEIAWLKSLRPQPHWKPSEEQMKQLHYALTPGSAFDCDILNELYTQLNELM